MSQQENSTSPRSAQLETWFREYEADHVQPNTKLTHMVGIPLIVIGLMKLLQRVSMGPTNLALLVVIGIVVFFAKHDKRLATAFGASLFGVYVFSFIFLSVSLAWFVFVVGWGLQFWGHYKYEKQSPAFAKNLLHLLIGPLWILARFTGMR